MRSSSLLKARVRCPEGIPSNRWQSVLRARAAINSDGRRAGDGTRRGVGAPHAMLSRGAEVAELVSLVPAKTEAWLTRTILSDIGAAADEAVMRGLYAITPGARLPSRVGTARRSKLHPTRTRASASSEHSAQPHRSQSDLSQLVHHAPRSHRTYCAARVCAACREASGTRGCRREAVAHLETALGMSIRWIHRSAPTCLKCMRQNATRPIRSPRR